MQAGEYRTMRSAFRCVCSGRAMVFDPATRSMVLDPSSSVLSVRQRVASLYRGASLLLLLQGFFSSTLCGLNGIFRALLTPYIPGTAHYYRQWTAAAVARPRVRGGGLGGPDSYGADDAD